MDSLLWLGLISFALSLVLTPIFRDVFRSYGVVDQPDQGRKIHRYPIPRVGGIAIACAYVGAFLLAPSRSAILDRQLDLVWRLLPAAGVVFAVGVIDDLFGLKPWQKLAGQLGGAILAYSAGVRIFDLVGYHAEAWWSLPVTIFWLLACTNAFNLVDGMDGLASGVGLFSTLTIFVAALLHKNAPLAAATIPLAGCLLGFLCYNFNPATIFLGDSGSLLIGFLLGCYGVVWTQKSATLLGMTAPLMALSIPLLDVGLAIARRFLRKQPIFSADRGHIHHRLLDRGFTPRKAAVLLYGICSIVAVFSLLQSISTNDRISGVIVLLFCGVAWIGIQYLGYAEFSIAGRLLFRGYFQETLKAQMELRSFEKKLAETRSLNETWAILVTASPQFGFCASRMEAGGQIFENLSNQHAILEHWDLRIPLSETQFMELRRDMQSPAPATIVGLFVDLLRVKLGAKLSGLDAQVSLTPAKQPGARTGLAKAEGLN